MNIAVIGTGYVGLVSGACFAELGHEVVCVDKDESKIRLLADGDIPIYEPGLKELIAGNRAAGRLAFAAEPTGPVRNAEFVILAVGTPQTANGAANLQYIEQAAREVAGAMNGYTIVMTKSTVPVGTNERIRRIIGSIARTPFDVVSVPEFLREGSAIADTFRPDRIVIGADRREAADAVARLHRPLTDNIVVTDVRSAEMIKYASNAFLATKISFINEIANICEKVGADVAAVAEGMGKDARIGPASLNAGIGYGGSCFPKDTHALIQIAGNVEYDFLLLRSVVEVNRRQRLHVVSKLMQSLGSLEKKRIGVWGLSFKPHTDDVREAPSLEIVPALIAAGARVQAYDPVALEPFRSVCDHEHIEWCRNPTEAAANADALCLLTEWPEFVRIDLRAVERVMKRPILVDGRNAYSAEQIGRTGFYYYSVGRPMLNRDVPSAGESAAAGLKTG